MNISSYISSFNSYLRILNRLKNTDYTVTDSSESIILYSDVFKEYISDKIGINVESVDVSDLLNMEYKDGKLVDSSIDDSDLSDTDDEAIEPKNLSTSAQTGDDSQDATILDFLNMFMEDEKFKTAMDFDNDGQLTNDDINSFLSGIKNLDNDDSSLSINDVLTAAKSIQDGTFKTNADGSVLISDDETQAVSEQSESSVQSQDASSGAQKSSSSQSASSSGGNYQQSSTDTQEQQQDTNPLANMTEDQLKVELETAKSTLSTKQNELSEISNGTNSELTAKQAEVDALYQTYIDETNKVSPELAQLIQDVAAKEQEISAADVKVTNCESNVAVCENAKTNAENILSNLINKKSELEAQSGKTDLTEEQKSSISAKLSSIQSEIAAAEANKNQAVKDLAAANTEKEQAVADKAVKEAELAQLNAEKTALEADVEAANPAVKTAKEAYEAAKSELDSQKTQLVEAKKAEIAEAQQYVIQVQNALATAKTNNDNNNFSTEPQYNPQFGSALAKAAEAMANSLGTVGYCLRGVAETLKDFFDQKTALSGLGSAYLSAEKLETDPMLKQCFTKVDVPRDQLANLPAGCIVVWQRGGPTKGGQKHGHIAITLGGGKEASDHVQNQVVRDCEYSVYYPTGNYQQFIQT